MLLAGQIQAGIFKVGVQIKEESLHIHLSPDAATYPVPFPTIVAPVQAMQTLVTLSI